MILVGKAGNIELRSKEWPGFLYGGDNSVPPPTWRGSGFDRDDAAGVPAAFRAVAIAGDAVAGMDVVVMRGVGVAARSAPRAWQSVFFGDQPNADESWPSMWMQTESSVTADGNGYWWLVYDAQMRVSAVQVLDPSIVAPRRDAASGRKVFDVRTRSGKETYASDRVLHFRGVGNPGDVKAPNPVDVFADALGAAVSRMRYESDFYENGMGQGLALIYPSDMTAQQAKDYKDALGPAQGGIANKVRVFGGGPSLQGIGISPRDAQFIEAMNFTVEDVARIYGVPASLLDLGGAKSAGMPLSPEHEMTRWLRFGLEPRLRRIEAAINHHPAFFGSGAALRFAFKTDGVLRGDLATEDAISHQQIQDGRLLVDEWRVERGMVPLPDGVGMIPQIVPVGGAPNPVAAPTIAASGDTARDVARLFEVAAQRSGLSVPVQPIHVTVAPAENPAPIVNVTVTPADVAPIIQLESPAVTVNVEPTPVTVNVEPASPTVEVVVPQGDRRVTIQRDQYGEIKSAEIVEV